MTNGQTQKWHHTILCHENTVKFQHIQGRVYITLIVFATKKITSGPFPTLPD